MASFNNVLGTVALCACAVTVSTELVAQNQEIMVDAALGAAIEERMPVDTGSAFPVDVGRVWLWTRVSGAGGRTLSHVWSHGDNEWSVELQIGADQWRTWSNKTIPPEWTGEWKVEVRDENGNVLKTLTFTVGSGM